MNGRFAGKLKALAVPSLMLGAVFNGLTSAEPTTGSSAAAPGDERRFAPATHRQEGAPGREAAKPPKECEGLQPRVVLRGVQDNFAAPPKPASPNPALLAYIGQHPRVNYDEAKFDSFFGDSFPLGNCKVCHATLEIRLRQTGPTVNGYVFGGPYNDTFAVGGAPFAPAVLSGFLYPPGTGGGPLLTVTRTYVLPAAALNSYIFSGSFAPKMLDVVIEDDEVVDYIKLTLW